MAREMIFAMNGKEYNVEPIKIDRKKLYGWSEVRAFDDDGNECVLVSTDTSGTIIIPKGGIGLGILSNDGRWVERNHLKAVDADGNEVAKNTSTYNKVNVLTQKATEEEFLDCSIKALYQLCDADNDFIDAIGNDIYKIDYCYNDSYETSPAFLLTSETDGKKGLFLFIGVQNVFEFIGLNQIAVAVGDEEAEEEEDSDEIDFSMF